MIGVDLGQFALDPFGSGVQRVLQQLAAHWPKDRVAEFAVPLDGSLAVLTPDAAFDLLSTTFVSRPADHEAPALIRSRVESLTTGYVDPSRIADRYSSWLVPEMTYDPANLQRIRRLQSSMPVVMIAYDALQMSNPENYFFTPGTHACVSEYLRLLRDAPTVICISEFTLQQMFEVLRRPGDRPTLVAHPGGDHIPIAESQPPLRPRFLRVGTMEARKHPVEIVSAFMAAVDDGLEADLEFIGSPSRVDVSINLTVERAVDSGYPVTWRKTATDADVADAMATSTAFLSYGVEGYGIPVLEAIRRGLPVLFDGIQPSAELMEGKGAMRFELAGARGSWQQAVAEVQGGGRELDSTRVPQWDAFASAVVGVMT